VFQRRGRNGIRATASRPPAYGAQLIDNFVGNDDRPMVTAATVAALKLKNPWAAGAALVVWTGTNAFQAGSGCAVSSRAVYQ
jgi:hypothetical protein